MKRTRVHSPGTRDFPVTKQPDIHYKLSSAWEMYPPGSSTGSELNVSLEWLRSFQDIIQNEVVENVIEIPVDIRTALT